MRNCDDNLMCLLCIERGTWSVFIGWGLGVLSLCVQLHFRPEGGAESHARVQLLWGSQVLNLGPEISKHI